jgi:hypothetical protein
MLQETTIRHRRTKNTSSIRSTANRAWGSHISSHRNMIWYFRKYRDLECGSILCKEKVILQVGMSPILDFLIGETDIPTASLGHYF